MPRMAPRSKVFFHDSNIRRVYRRNDGSWGTTGTPRGVAPALKQYLGAEFDENTDFIDFRKGWTVRHHANCCGLTVLERDGQDE